MGATHYPSRPSYAQHSVQGASSIYLSATYGLSHGDDHKIREGMTVVSNLPSSQHEENDRTLPLDGVGSWTRSMSTHARPSPAFVCIFLEAMTDGGDDGIPSR